MLDWYWPTAMQEAAVAHDTSKRSASWLAKAGTSAGWGASVPVQVPPDSVSTRPRPFPLSAR